MAKRLLDRQLMLHDALFRHRPYQPSPVIPMRLPRRLIPRAVRAIERWWRR